MKKILSNPIFYVCSWFVAVSIFAAFVTSCKTSHISCDAYGNYDHKMGLGHEIMTVEKAKSLEISK